MKMIAHKNLSSEDRVMRVIVGIALAMMPLYFADNVGIITATVFASMYPLFTALVATDPLVLIIENIKLKWNEVASKKQRPSGTAQA